MRHCFLLSILLLSCHTQIQAPQNATTKPTVPQPSASLPASQANSQPSSAPFIWPPPNLPKAVVGPPVLPPEPPSFVRRAQLDTVVTAPSDAKTIASLYLIGDSQLHHLNGKRTFAQSGWVDKSVEVAVRPAPLDLSSDLLLDEFLRFRDKNNTNSKLIYMGDATDISCQQELSHFFSVMAARGLQTPNKKGKPWLMLTSNHDGFFVGNYTQRDDADGALAYTDMPNEWMRACADPGSQKSQILTKGAFVKAAANIVQDNLLAGDLSYDTRSAASTESYKTDHLYYTQRLDDGSAPLALYGIFLDTVDYRTHTNLTETMGAGVVGAISPEQLSFVRSVVARKTEAHPDIPVYFALFGHHPIESLTADSREDLGGALLSVGKRVIGYFGAHEHKSRINTTYLGALPIRQFVTGSTTDWPQEGRLVNILWSQKEKALAIEAGLLTSDPSPCAKQPRMYEGPFAYTAYQELRGDPPSKTGLAWNEFWGDYTARKETLLSALRIENFQVRQFAKLFSLAPSYQKFANASDQEAIQSILTALYAAAESETSMQALLKNSSVASRNDYERWFDPKTLPESAVLYGAIHSFAKNAALFSRLDTLREKDRLYFLCHALAASEIEAKERVSRQGVFLVR